MSVGQIVGALVKAVATGVKIGATGAKIAGTSVVKGGLKGAGEAVKIIAKS